MQSLKYLKGLLDRFYVQILDWGDETGSKSKKQEYNKTFKKPESRKNENTGVYIYISTTPFVAVSNFCMGRAHTSCPQPRGPPLAPLDKGGKSQNQHIAEKQEKGQQHKRATTIGRERKLHNQSSNLHYFLCTTSPEFSVGEYVGPCSALLAPVKNTWIYFCPFYICQCGRFWGHTPLGQ